MKIFGKLHLSTRRTIEITVKKITSKKVSFRINVLTEEGNSVLDPRMRDITLAKDSTLEFPVDLTLEFNDGALED